ncbi:MAG: hypothetical protein HY318_15600, partial [Armatimonadetes bacterium]|nr:hypothetical protein [Armatimonadota bacterium]
MRVREWVVDNPVLRYHLLGRARWVWRRPGWTVRAVAYSGLVLYLWSYFAALSKGGLPWVLGLEILVLFLLSIPITHGLLAGEFERATWESLVLTRLTAGQIIVGKIASRLALVVLIVVLFQPVVFLASATSFVYIPDRLLYFYLLKTQCVVVSWTLFMVAMTSWLSYRIRRGMTTAAVAFGVEVFLLVLFPLLVALFDSVFFPALPDPFEALRKSAASPFALSWAVDLRYLVFYYNPVVVIFSSCLEDDWFSYGAGRWELPGLWGPWQSFVYLLMAFLILLHLLHSVSKATRKP